MNSGPDLNAGPPSAKDEHGESLQKYLAAMIASSDDAIIGKDLNSIITYWNRGAEKIFGYTAAEVRGTSILPLIPADRHAEENSILGRIKAGAKVEPFETLRQTRAGRQIHVSVSASPVRNDDATIVGALVIARDISAQKEHAHEVARLNQLYAARSQVNQAIVWTPTREQLFQKVCSILIEAGGFHMASIGWHDPATRQIMPVAVCGDEQDYIHNVEIYSDDRPEGRGPGGLSFRSGLPYICNDMLNNPVTLPWRAELRRRRFRASAVFPIRLKNEVCALLTVYSDEPWFFQNKEIALLTGAAADISFALDNFAEKETRLNVETIAENERLFSATMIESMPGILYFYDEQGRFLRWNKNFELVSGYSSAEIARMHPLDFFPGESKPVLQQRIADVFTKGGSSVEASFLAKDGSTTPYFFTGRRVVFNGQACLVGMGLDISERKRAEQALRVLNQTLELEVATRTSDLQAALVRAEAADRIKSAFLATMSHELRTPLNSIIGFTGIVLQGLAGPLTTEQTKQLGMVQNSARHLLELINDVLDLSKIEAGQLEVRAAPFRLHDSLERVVGLVKPMADKKNLSLTVVAPQNLGEVNTDRRRVEQILLNLVNNAIKFTERGGVTITVEKLPAPQPGPPPTVRLRVSDTGMGIKPENLALLFQPFRQIDSGLTRQHDGTGLGLAICRRLATLLGGEISATSEWARGTEFIVTLPAQLPPAV